MTEVDVQLEKPQHDHMNEREEKGELSWVGLSWVELGWVGVEQTLHIGPLPRHWLSDTVKRLTAMTTAFHENSAGAPASS